MSSVWYIGSSDTRLITAASWLQIGVEGVDTNTWNAANGWSIPTTEFTEEQLSILDRIGNFNTDAPNGPRQGSPGSYYPDEEPATKGYVDQAIQDALEAGLPSLIDCGGPNSTNGA